MEYYIIVIIYKTKKNYLIWFSNDRNEKDGLINNNNEILLFSHISNLLNYTRKADINLKEKDITAEYNFDKLIHWANSRSGKVNCNTILNFWNLFDDLSYSANTDFKGNEKDEVTNKIYDKLFFGCNLLHVKGERNDYYPLWKMNELKLMKSILRNGLEIYKNNIIFSNSLD